MLERPQLLLSPWRLDPREGVSLRDVRDPETGIALGVVRWSRRTRRSIWGMFSPRVSCELFETDDRSLLMALRPGVLTRDVWGVFDCDGNEVGKLRGDELLDPWSEPFARRVAVDGGWSVREFDGREYAKCVETADGDQITFAAAEITNPFLRMLALGSLLLMRALPL